MKATFLVSVATLAVSALADSYIPADGISAGCASFLTGLDSDPGLQSCTSSLLTATQAYASGNASSTALSSTLSALCSTTSTSCSGPSVRSLLSDFWGACDAELSKPVDGVVYLYDTMYAMMPFRAAVCAQDASTGNYCASSLGSSSGGSSRKRSLPMVNGAAMQSAGTPYQFMLPSSPATDLCTACGKSIMQAYVTWEAELPYALGLSSSAILGGQKALWNAISTKCGAGFVSTITADSNAAPLAALGKSAAFSTKPVLSALVGIAGLGAALLMH